MLRFYSKQHALFKVHECIKLVLEGKKTAIILPASAMDNGHERELDCNDTGCETKNIHQ